jgi:hypothetical protein
MVEQVTMWQACGQLFTNQDDAVGFERRQEMITKVEEFLHSRDVDRQEAESVALIISENLGWFRTVLDAAAGKG